VTGKTKGEEDDPSDIRVLCLLRAPYKLPEEPGHTGRRGEKRGLIGPSLLGMQG